jgi:putative ABC transport system permease protein
MNALHWVLAAVAHRPLPNLLHLLLMGFASGLIGLMLMAGHQLEARAARDAQQIDLVLGAPGSPLQLVLSSVYQVDNPTGNIPVAAARRWAQHPLVASAVPIALGDSVEGYRIIGTTPEYLGLYGAELAEGRPWSRPLEAVIGAELARDGWTLGRRFVGAHGLEAGGHRHDDQPYRVVGVLAPTGTVIDRLVLTAVESVWSLHAAPAADGSDRAGHDDDQAHDHEHGHGHEHEHEHEEAAASGLQASPAWIAGSFAELDERESVTALLIRFRSLLAAALLPREVQAEGRLMAATPAQEILRLRLLADGALQALTWLALALMALAGLAMLAALNSALESRRHDLAILRALGATRWRLVGLLALEASLLALLGSGVGLLLAHLGAEALGRALPGRPFTGAALIPAEAWIPALALAVAALAVILPALRVLRVDVAAVLSRP